MHEFSLLDDLLKKINKIAAQQDAIRVTAVQVRIGALAHISGDHFREHFVHATRGGLIENARLDIEESRDKQDPQAQDILLQSIEVEAADGGSTVD